MRPLVISLGAALLLLVICRLILKDWRRAALLVSFWLILFFTYGHLYQVLKSTAFQGFSLGRHRYLLVIYLGLLGAGTWWIVRKVRDLSLATQALNIISLLLLVYPTYQVTSFYLNASTEQKHAERLPEASVALADPPSTDLPDVYYIILDGYTRGDALQRDLGYDNSAFLNELRKLGFYVAGCSRSNYSYTVGSLTSALNMDYLPALEAQLEANGMDPKDLWVLLKQSLVRRTLEAMGYQTVAFETGYEWSRLADADIYLGLAKESYAMQRLNPFEAMLVKSSLILPLADARYLNLKRRFEDVNFPYQDHINGQLFILGEIPKIARTPDPTFAFIHVLIPHVPYVFGPDGEILADPGYYGGRKSAPINREYERKGYTGEVTFINARILEDIKAILEESDTPPVIIIQGDHGLRKDNRMLILNAYHLPGEGEETLYPSISPVNSFRVVFDEVFGTSYGLLPDVSYPRGGDYNTPADTPVEEKAPECLEAVSQ